MGMGLPGGFDISSLFAAWMKDPKIPMDQKMQMAAHLDKNPELVPPPQDTGSEGGAGMLPSTGLAGMMANGEAGGLMGMPGMGGGLGGLLSMLGVGGSKEPEAAPTGGAGEPSLGSMMPTNQMAVSDKDTSPMQNGAPNSETNPWETTVTPEPQGSTAKTAGNMAMGAAQGLALQKPPGPADLPRGVTGGAQQPNHPAANPAFLNMIAALLNHPAPAHATAGASPGIGQILGRMA